MNEIRKESCHNMNKIVSTTNGKPFTPKHPRAMAQCQTSDSSRKLSIQGLKLPIGQFPNLVGAKARLEIPDPMAFPTIRLSDQTAA
jgi:hypothetical protein